MSKIITIYCEGKKGSHDYDILEKIIAGLPNIQIEPIGSIRGARSIIQYKEGGVTKSNFYILFRDRDFDKPIPSEVTLELDKKGDYCYFSYRNTIENYLFDIFLFFSFLQSNKLYEKYMIHSEDDVKNRFIQAAERIKYYQAVRHTMGYMRTGETNFGTRWTEKSGKLPSNLDEESCKEEAWNKIAEAKSVADSRWTQNKFLENYQNFITKFNTDFMENLDFLIYFQGKDFAASLSSILPNFPLKSYYKFAKNHFDSSKFPDLVQLRELIKRQQR